MHPLKKAILPVLDLCMAPFLVPSAVLMRILRRAGVERMPLCRKVLNAVGVFPVSNHYYEPLTDFRLLLHPLNKPRRLPGVDLNAAAQLELLKSFRFSDELKKFGTQKTDDLTYAFGNGYFDAGDAEFWYNLIRVRKPRRIVEIGSGNSTLLAIEAVRANEKEDPGYRCQHICVEPYEMPWLERSGVQVLRERVESVDQSVFGALEAGDILFIDSSHVIRPQGDVLCEFLEIMPALNKGVIVHIHDIFTPRDYPHAWVVEKVRLWNEQYLMEALISGNPQWKIIGALNYLKHDHFEQFQRACPFVTSTSEPGSFYLEKV